MPTTRRSTGGARARPGPAKGQSTISFSNKVTKTVPKDLKKSLVTPTAEKADLSPATKSTEPEEEVDEIELDQAETKEDEEDAAPEKSEAQLRADKVTNAQITKYWKGIESQRLAPRVHQEGLSRGEQILRYFDVSSQFGPCVGIQRTKRWERADRLGLNPPIEVLAVLLNEEKDGNNNTEQAHMDQILNSTAVGAV